MPSCSAIDLAEIRRSSKISSWIWSIIPGVVGLKTYQHPGVFSCDTYKNWETAQRLSRHYDPLSQAVLLWKAKSKRAFFCFTAVFICNVWEGCRVAGIWFVSKTGTCHLHCCRWEFTIKALLCNTRNASLCCHRKMVTRTRHSVTLHVLCFSCWI
jgi:hypothetical protein